MQICLQTFLFNPLHEIPGQVCCVEMSELLRLQGKKRLEPKHFVGNS